jgi:hypothetical protein
MLAMRLEQVEAQISRRDAMIIVPTKLQSNAACYRTAWLPPLYRKAIVISMAGIAPGFADEIAALCDYARSTPRSDKICGRSDACMQLQALPGQIIFPPS